MSSYTSSTTCSLLIHVILPRTDPGFKACNAPYKQTDVSRIHSRSICSNWSGIYWDTWSPAEKFSKSTRVRIKSMNCFKNISLLVKHLPLLSFPRVSNSTYTSSSRAAGLWRHQQFPWLVISSNSHAIQRVFIIHMDAKSQIPQTEHFPLPSTLVFEQNGRESSHKIPLELQAPPEKVQSSGVQGL